jgi:hypothetical protein
VQKNGGRRLGELGGSSSLSRNLVEYKIIAAFFDRSLLSRKVWFELM